MRGQVAFVVLTVLLIVVLIVMIVLAALSHKWKVRNDVPLEEVDLETERFKEWNTGDLLFVFSQGHLLWATGHVALIIRLRHYQQLYVWDMPNPLFHPAPTVCKPLRSYLKSCFKKSLLNMGQVPRVYVQHLVSPSLEAQHKISEGVAPLVRNLASNATFDKAMIRTHLMFCLKYCFFDKMKNVPKKTKKKTKPPKLHKQEPQKHTCTSSVLGIMSNVGVFTPNLLSEKRLYNGENWEHTTQNQNIYPHMFIHEDWSFDPYMKNGFTYTPLVEIAPKKTKKKPKKKEASEKDEAEEEESDTSSSSQRRRRNKS